MKKTIGLEIIIFSVILMYHGFALTSYKNPTLGFSLELPDGWRKTEDSPRPYYVTFYGPKDTSGFVPTFVIAVAEKQKDFKSFVDASIKEAQKSTKDYKLKSKECKKTKSCKVLATYSFDPKSVMVDSKDKAFGKLPIKSMQIFIGGDKKFYILTAGCFTMHFAKHEKIFTRMINSFKEDKADAPKEKKNGLLDRYFKE
jgi:hypothetical protein